MKSGARLEGDHRWHMVRGLVGTAKRAFDGHLPDRCGKIAARPDMIQPAAAVAGRPVARPIGPPGIQNFIRSEMRPHRVVPSAFLDQTHKTVTFDRCMADHLLKLFGRPDILGKRRDVQVTDKDRALRRIGGEMRCHLGNEIELVAKFRIRLSVGNVAAGGNIEIMHARSIPDRRGNMPAILAPGPVQMCLIRQRQARNDGNAIIAFLAPVGLMPPAGLRQRVGREMRILGFGLLKAQHVDVVPVQKLEDEWQAQPDRIDVPGGKFHGVSLAGDNRIWRRTCFRSDGRTACSVASRWSSHRRRRGLSSGAVRRACR